MRAGLRRSGVTAGARAPGNRPRRPVHVAGADRRGRIPVVACAAARFALRVRRTGRHGVAGTAGLGGTVRLRPARGAERGAVEGGAVAVVGAGLGRRVQARGGPLARQRTEADRDHAIDVGRGAVDGRPARAVRDGEGVALLALGQAGPQRPVPGVGVEGGRGGPVEAGGHRIARRGVLDGVAEVDGRLGSCGPGAVAEGAVGLPARPAGRGVAGVARWGQAHAVQGRPVAGLALQGAGCPGQGGQEERPVVGRAGDAVVAAAGRPEDGHHRLVGACHERAGGEAAAVAGPTEEGVALPRRGGEDHLLGPGEAGLATAVGSCVVGRLVLEHPVRVGDRRSQARGTAGDAAHVRGDHASDGRREEVDVVVLADPPFERPGSGGRLALLAAAGQGEGEASEERGGRGKAHEELPRGARGRARCVQSAKPATEPRPRSMRRTRRFASRSGRGKRNFRAARAGSEASATTANVIGSARSAWGNTRWVGPSGPPSRGTFSCPAAPAPPTAGPPRAAPPPGTGSPRRPSAPPAGPPPGGPRPSSGAARSWPAARSG